MPSTPIYALPYPAATDPADVPTDMQELAVGVEAMYKELAYAQITADVSVAVLTEATAVTVVSAGAVTFDGTPILLEFFTMQAQLVVNGAMLLNLWDGGTNLGYWGQWSTAGGAGVMIASACLRRRLTPTAGSHTYIVKAWSTAGTNTVGAGPGGAASTKPPAYLRITRA